MSVSRAIRELEQRGLIIRRIGPNDRRSQSLFLTRKGRRVYDTVVPDANARYHDIVDCLAPTERARLTPWRCKRPMRRPAEVHRRRKRKERLEWGVISPT